MSNTRALARQLMSRPLRRRIPLLPHLPWLGFAGGYPCCCDEAGVGSDVSGGSSSAASEPTTVMCADCEPSGTAAYRYLLVIAGVTNPPALCSSCTDINGSYVVSWCPGCGIQPSPDCLWRGIGPDLCEHKGFTADPCEALETHIFMGFSGSSLSVGFQPADISSPPLPDAVAVKFDKTVPLEDRDCLAWDNYAIDTNVSAQNRCGFGNQCGISAATCHVTALL